jgi:hypothetical protein
MTKPLDTITRISTTTSTVTQVLDITRLGTYITDGQKQPRNNEQLSSTPRTGLTRNGSSTNRRHRHHSHRPRGSTNPRRKPRPNETINHLSQKG